jgi:putative membrane protein
MEHVTTSALAPPTMSSIVTAWTLQPLAAVVAVLALTWYLLARRRTAPWSRQRTTFFLVGLGLFVWSTNGMPQVYAHALFWMWTTQLLLLLLIVPVLIMAGQPIALDRQVGGARAPLVRFSESRIGRFFTNPLVGPAAVPALSLVLFFGPLPRWAISHDALYWPLQVLIVIIGALVVLPLVTSEDSSTSMAVGLALVIGIFELILDAIPGIVLRLSTHPVTSYFDVRTPTSWAPTPLRDQQIAGSILWAVAELIDVPFLILIYRQWVRADARDAARIDVVLDAERVARGSEDAEATDAPWWLNDPAMKDRLRRN